MVSGVTIHLSVSLILLWQAGWSAARRADLLPRNLSPSSRRLHMVETFPRGCGGSVLHRLSTVSPPTLHRRSAEGNPVDAAAAGAVLRHPDALGFEQPAHSRL